MSDNEDKDTTSTNERKEENMEDDIPEEESKSENSEEKPQSSKSANGESSKTPVKEKVVKLDQKEEENEEEEGSGSDEESPKLGLLERPVVIESGKRERKKVERLSTADSTPKETKKVEIGEGSGDKLGDCPRIELQISKTKTDDLKNLHRFLFNRVGKATEVKRNIRQFNGFTFSSSDQEHTKKLTHLKKQTIAMLKVMCEVLDLEKKGTRDVIAERVMDFCMCPKDSGKKLPAPKRKRSSGGKKKGTKKEKNEKKKKPAKEKKSKAMAEDSDDEEKSEEEEDEEENEEENEHEEEEEEEAPKKKKARTESPKKTEMPKKTETPRKTETPKKKKAETKKKEVSSPEISDSSDEDEDEPLQAKKKQPPSNDELKGVVKKILDKANLEEVTMKTVVKQVYAKYPDFDLTDRKDFIKNTVKQMIS